MDRKSKCIIWVATILLVAMLGTIYFATDAIENRNVSSNIPSEYREKALLPSNPFIIKLS